MSDIKHVIIGAGPAAQAAAKSIRSIDKEAAITFVTREKTMPYSPVALPYLINGELKDKDLFEKGEALIKNLNVNVVPGKEVIDIKPDENKIVYSDGAEEGYDKLLIATGAAPTTVKIDGIEENELSVFRTYDDFEKMHSRLEKNAEVLIYGAGLVAVELAEKLNASGYKVTIVVRSYLLRKYFSKANIEILQNLFNKKGINIITGKTVTKGEKHDGKFSVELSDGSKMETDHIVMATGVSANFIGEGLFEKSGGGIKVNSYLETQYPNIYAAGDVAAPPDYTGKINGTCPISPEAALQGRIAGRNMTGQKEKYTGWVSSNYLRCFEENLFSIGVLEGETELYDRVLDNRDEDKNIKLYFKKDALVGVEGFNMKSIHPGVFRHLICEQVPVKSEKELLLSKPKETAVWLMMNYHNAVKS